MMPINHNDSHLAAMTLVETCSNILRTTSWIWGGLTVDVYENRFLREHEDLDYLTLNLHDLIPQFIETFKNHGWKATVLINGDLGIEREGIHIHLGHVELSTNIRWTHNGDKGSIWFPREWLSTKPVSFCGKEIHVVEPEFQYVMIENHKMLNPKWNYRQKDIDARNYLRNVLISKGVHLESLFEEVRDC